MYLRAFLNLIVLQLLMISCNTHEHRYAENDARIHDSIVAEENRTLGETARDSTILDEEFVFGLIDKVLSVSLHQNPDSIALVENLHAQGVMDTMRYVSGDGFKAVLYHVAYDGRHILWEADIDLESELGILLWKDVSSNHIWPTDVLPKFVDFEVTNEVSLIMKADGSGRFVYCLLHRE